VPSLLQRARNWLGVAGAAPVSGTGGWWPIVREPYTGAWQSNVELTVDNILSNPVVFRCVSLIATDIGKLRLRLVALDDDGVWQETTSTAFSPVLRKPNRYQTMPLFLESWMWSKLIHGNTYVWKQRDLRNVVTALYVLHPQQVTPLVAPDTSVYYELKPNDLAGIPQDSLVVPASDVIHDRWNCVFHPLVGVSPLYACGATALQGLSIQTNSLAYFANGSRPDGVILIPGDITDERLQKLVAGWKAAHGGSQQGSVAALPLGMKYEPVAINAVDSQLTEQAALSVKTIAGAFGVPISMVDSAQQPPYANSEASLLQYHSQCLQTHLNGIETALDEGLELPTPYGTEFDIDDLVWLDTQSKTKAAHEAIAAGALSPNEARFKWFGLGPVEGGDTPYLQQQYWSLAAAAAREAAPAPAPGVAPPPVEEAAV
jgi:HK97 family phage portal protein